MKKKGKVVKTGYHVSAFDRPLLPRPSHGYYSDDEEEVFQAALAAYGSLECFYCKGEHRAMICPIRIKVSRAGSKLREKMIKNGTWEEPTAAPNRPRGRQSNVGKSRN
jgi:hypothetical protein